MRTSRSSKSGKRGVRCRAERTRAVTRAYRAGAIPDGGCSDGKEDEPEASPRERLEGLKSPKCTQTAPYWHKPWHKDDGLFPRERERVP